MNTLHSRFPLMGAILTLMLVSQVPAQTASDSVTVTFRAYKPSSPPVYVPGQFNLWGHNAGGVIPANDPSLMTYDGGSGAWVKSYKWKIHDPLDANRTLGDSVYEYKFNQGGSSTGWYADPLNPETNPNDNGNSILRLAKLSWFEFYGALNNNQYTRLQASVIQTNGDTVSAIRLSTGTTQASSQTVLDVTAGYNASTRVLDYALLSPIPKANYIRLVATNTHGDSAVYAQGGYSLTYMPMPSYARNGLTLPAPASNDSATFRLRVTWKDYVLVRIAPLGNPVATAAPVVMRHATNNADWWMNVKLAPGTYEYVYEIENGKQIYDPWGRYDGTYGSRFTVGPAGLTDDNYVWHNASFQRPPLNKLVIYEMNLAEEVGGTTGKIPGQINFTDLIPLLPHFQSLGINAIELMPITDYGNIGASGFSWGYDLSSYLSIEPGYGTPADLKALVDSAHGRGIAMIL